ncbi:MAG TPA: hypothetical protein VF765_12370 [Polyangiaceae bacterium]
MRGLVGSVDRADIPFLADMGVRCDRYRSLPRAFVHRFALRRGAAHTPSALVVGRRA